MTTERYWSLIYQLIWPGSGTRLEILTIFSICVLWYVGIDSGFCSRFFVLFWMKYLGERSGSWCNISLEHDSVTRFRVLILMCGIVTGHVSQTLTLQANSNPEPFPPIMLRKQEVRWYDAWQHIWNVLNHTTTVVNNSAVALWSQNTQADSKCIYFTLCVWVCLSQAPRCVCQIL